MAPAQGFISSYAPRLRQYNNAFLTPVLQTQAIAPASRVTKRGTTIINYADDAYDDDDFDSEDTRRPTGLRSIRREDLEKKEAQHDRLGQEIYEPVNVQAIYRDWMIRRAVKPTYDNTWSPHLLNMILDGHSLNLGNRTDQQVHIQAQLPLTLIPIRIDLDIPAHQQDTPMPPPPRGQEHVFNAALPQYKRPEPSPPYKLRDIFLWNLHESLLTPDDFAQVLVRELDLPNQTALTVSISQQIRTQLEEYAGVALHPLFHNQPKLPPQTQGAPTTITNGAGTPRALTNGRSRDGTPATPRPVLALQGSQRGSQTPNASTPAPSTPGPTQFSNGALITAEATLIPESIPQAEETDPYLNPDDTYRCIINLSISLSSRLYSDKFEWSLLHPPGAAELFAKQTCADMGLSGEWVLAITHAIYEAVLRLKKEACEGGMYGLELDNQCVRYEEGAGWRYDADDFGAEWEPKFEKLAKEEIEKREGDRERQLRRLRRETARFSSTAGMVPSARENEARERADYFGGGYGSGVGGGGDETPVMGRGERSKKKRRFRSLSPVAKALNAETSTPGGGINGAGTGWGGAANQLSEYERQNWRCKWCQVWGSAVWAVRDGPTGPRTLCNNCGLLYERDKRLPVWSEGLHRHDIPAGAVVR